MEKINDYFKRYPTSEEVYENGGLLFHNRGAADSYGQGETNRHTRKQSAVNEELSKNDAMANLKAVEDLSALSYDALKSFTKILELKPESNSKENILKVLSEYKATLNAE